MGVRASKVPEFQRSLKEPLVSWTVPEQIKLTMTHHLESKSEPGLRRSRLKETTCVVPRPDSGETRIAVTCGHCGRDGVFVIQDRATTRRMRRWPVVRSLVVSAVLLAVVVGVYVAGFGGGSVLFEVLAIPSTIIFGPVLVFLMVDPSSNIGVKAPEHIFFKGDTVREGLSLATRNSHKGEGLACMGRAEPAS